MIDPAEKVALLDLTSLTGTETEADIAALCARAHTPAGDVAAVCVPLAHVTQCADALQDTPVAVATVANFPDGSEIVERAVADCEAAVAAGADEIDVVMPWRAFVEGDDQAATRVLTAARKKTPNTILKVILESGAYPDEPTIRAGADLALDAGADFVKTSTGQYERGATPAAAAAILQAIADAGHGGLKVSGGVRTVADADTYLALATQKFGPAWISPKTFRFGASGLLDALLAAT